MRVRMRFGKVGKIRWTSHRDVARMWERAFRRVDLPLAYSEGFSPRPKVSFGLALPTGYESVAEFLDVEALLEPADVDFESLATRLTDALPVGVDCTAAAVLGPGTPSLQEDVSSCSWRWVAVGPVDLAEKVDDVLGATSLVVSRSRKGVEVTEDVRGGIWDLKLIGPFGPDPSDGCWLEAELACHPRSIRPAEVSSALGPGVEARMVRRTHQWIMRDGARLEPLVPGFDVATDAPHALERAS
jgi:radical SAM-linked protein